jgi:hypothetical protein
MKAQIPHHLTGDFSQLPESYQADFLKVLEAQRIILKCPKQRKRLFGNFQTIQAHYLFALDGSREYNLTNLAKYLGRRYNMFINVPHDFERFNGRTYDQILG